MKFLLNVARQDLSGYARSGNDLVIEFKNGRKLRISDFFVHGADAHQLVVVEGNAHWWVKLAPQAAGDGAVEASFEAMGADSSSSLLGILGAALAATGLAAAAGGGGGGKGSTSATPEPTPPTPARPPVIDAVSGAKTVSGDSLMGKEGLEIRGSGAVPYGTLSVFVDGQLVGTTVADANGQWSYTVSGLPDGKHVISIQQTDVAGNVSELADINVVADTTPPPPPMPQVGSSGGSAPTLSGTAEPGSTIRIYDGDTQIAELVVGADGQWHFTPEKLGEGAHQLTVTATDAAGNESAPSVALVLTIDTIAPQAPGIVSVNGLLAEHLPSVAINQQPLLKGRAEPGSSVTIHDGDRLLGEAQMDEDGYWSFQAQLEDGSYQLMAKATDAAGNESLSSTPIDLTIDTTPPWIDDIEVSVAPRPTISGLAEPGSTVKIYNGETELGEAQMDEDGNWHYQPTLADGSYQLSAGAIDALGNETLPRTPIDIAIDTTPPWIEDIEVSVAPRPMISGRAEPGSTVKIYDGETELGEAQMDEDGNWHYQPALADGSYQLSAGATDTLGNETLPRMTIDLTIDTTPPWLEDIEVSVAPRPTISGRAEPGCTVKIYNGETELGEAQMDENGNWHYQPALADGSYQLSAGATDALGNETLPRTSIAITIDTTPPWIDDIEVSVAPRPTISGRAEPGSSVKIYDGETELGEAQMDEDGNWHYQPALADGSYQLSAGATDALGNEALPRTPIDLTIDTTPPWIDDIEISVAPRPTISGRAEPGSTVKIYDGETELGEAQMDEDGNWHYQPALADGSYQLSAGATDALGNETLPRTPIDIAIDTTPPWIEDIEVSVAPRPMISGRAEPGSTVKIYDGETELGEAQMDEDGNWHYQPALADGSYQLSAGATDTLGNETLPRMTIDLTIDTTPPWLEDIEVSVAPRPTISGRAEPGSTVKIYNGETELGEAQMDENGNWHYQPALADGSYQLSAGATDALGNETLPRTPIDITIDTTPPWIDDIEVSVAPRPTISGRAEPGSSVKIYNGTTELGQAQMDEDGNWHYQPTLADGSYQLSASATDALGNETLPRTPIDLTIDTTPPWLEDIEVSVAPRPMISGRAEPGSTVKIYNGETELGEAQMDEDGNWHYQPTLADGSYQLSAGATDALGNETLPRTSIDLTIDTTPPWLEDIEVSVAPRPTISGRAEPGSTVKIYNGETELGEAQMDEDGNWHYQPALADGSYQLSAGATDALGNETLPRTSIDLTIDTTPPWLEDIEVSVAPRPMVSGRAEPGSTVKVYNGETELGEAQMDEDGNWHYQPTLADGSYQLSAGATDALGNESLPRTPIDLTIDTTPPWLEDIEVSVAPRPMISGRAEPGSTVKIYNGETELGEAQMDEDGNWHYQPALADGSYQLSAGATDALGNESLPRTPIDLTIDTTPPWLEDIEVSVAPRPMISGRAEPGSTVKIYNGETELGEAQMDEDGNWHYQPTLADGSYQLSAGATDALGNETLPRTSIDLTIDTTPPWLEDIEVSVAPRPMVSGRAEPGSTVKIYNGETELGEAQMDEDGNWHYQPTLADGSYQLSAGATDALGNETQPRTPIDIAIDTTPPWLEDIEVSVAPRPTISGRAEPGSTVKIYNGETELGEAQMDEDGNWHYQPTLADGSYQLSAGATDALGNETLPRTPIAITIDTTPPWLEDIEVSVAPRPTISGRAEPGSTVKIYNGETELGEAQMDEDGNWHYQPALADGSYQLSAGATDALGNESLPRTPIDLTIDTTPPWIDDIEISVAPRPTISGRAEPGSTVKIYDGETELGEAQMDEDGNWHYQPMLEDGSYQLSAGATDALGNETLPRTPIDLTIDTTPPWLEDIEVSVAPRPTISGRAEPGSTVKIYNGETELGEAQMDENGNWHFQPTLADGSYQLSASATDALGNQTLPRTPIDLTIDTTPPWLEDIEVSVAPRPTISGRAEPGSTVKIYNGVTELGQAEIDEDGHWHFQPMLDEGSYQLTVKATDAAGNVSEAGEPVVLAVDTIPPPEVEILVDAWPVVSGRAFPGSMVKIYASGYAEPVASIEAAQNGSWSVNVPLVDGKYHLTVTASDALGNETQGVVFDIDTRPVIDGIDDRFGATRGEVEANGTTDDWRPWISGTGRPGSVLTVYSNELVLGTVTVSSQGTWEFQPPSILVNGAHSITVTSADNQGNASVPSDAFLLTVDRNVQLFFAHDANNNELTRGGIQTDKTAIYEGRVEPGNIVTVVLSYKNVIGTNFSNTYRAVADENGYWLISSKLPALAALNSPYIWTFTAVDAETQVTIYRVTQQISEASSRVAPGDGSEISSGLANETHPTSDAEATAQNGAAIDNEQELPGIAGEKNQGHGNPAPDDPLEKGSEEAAATAAADNDGVFGAVSVWLGATVAAEPGDEPLLLAAPDEAPIEDELPLDSGASALITAPADSADRLDGSVDFVLAPVAPDGERIDLAQLLPGGDLVQAEPLARVAAADNPAVAQDPAGVGDSSASAERAAVAIDFSADALAPAADMHLELEKLLAQQPLPVV